MVDFPRQDTQRIDALLASIDEALQVAKDFPIRFPERVRLIASYQRLVEQRERIVLSRKVIERCEFDEVTFQWIDVERSRFRAVLAKVSKELRRAIEELTPKD